jgi:hypothetical protein
MIVSHELSMIQMNEPLRAELAANIEAYLRVGGTIQELPGFGIVHRPPNYNRQMPPDFKGPITHQEDIEQLEKIRELAKTMTMAAVCKEVGLSRMVMRGKAKRHKIEFVKPFMGATGMDPVSKDDPEREAKLVKQIEKCRDMKMSRKRCYASIGIGNTLFSRLLRDHNINYPTMISAFR